MDNSAIERSTSLLVTDVNNMTNPTNMTINNMTNMTQNMTSNNLLEVSKKDKKNPLKRLKNDMPPKGKANEDKPNRRGVANLAVPVKLYISGRNLKNMDMFSKSDPLCVVFEKAQDSDDWFEIGRTEFIKDTLDPNFEKAIDIDYFFEKNQVLKFEFIDDDGGDSDDPYYDIIGSSNMNLSSIMASKGQTLSKPLLIPGKRKQRGMIIARAESIQQSNHQVSFQISTTGLRNKVPSCFGIMSFYGQTVYEIQRASTGNPDQFSKCFRSESQKGNSCVRFKKVKI